MKRKYRPRSSGLFLMELMLAILFFSIASAVCVQIFVKSHVLSRESEALSHAVNVCANFAEMINTAPEDIPEGDTLFYYDDAFVSCEEAEAVYTLTLHTEKDASRVTTHMDVTDASGKSLYTLDTTHHIARRTGHEKR